MSSDSELDNFLGLFSSKLNLTDHNQTNMPNDHQAQIGQQPNYTLLKMFIDTIVPYDGNPSTLNVFLSAGDFLFTTYGNYNDELLKNYLLRTIRMKLNDRAQILVGCRLELVTWEQIKIALNDCFGDKRNLECLEQDLFMATPKKNEHPLDFGKRLQVLRSALAQKINSYTNAEMNNGTKIIYLRQYDQVCLRTFFRGLPGHLQSVIRLKSPNCIELAMTQITEEENFHYTQNLFGAPVQQKLPPVPPKPQSYFPYQLRPNHPVSNNYSNNYFYNNQLIKIRIIIIQIMFNSCKRFLR